MNRTHRAKLAQETLEIIEQGSYRTKGGDLVEIRSLIEKCIKSTREFSPVELDDQRNGIQASPFRATLC